MPTMDECRRNGEQCYPNLDGCRSARSAPTLVRLSLHRWGSNDDDILSGWRPIYPLWQPDSPAIPAGGHDGLAVVTPLNGDTVD